jgi:hypothetical protein
MKSKISKDAVIGRLIGTFYWEVSPIYLPITSATLCVAVNGVESQPGILLLVE